ncbi:MAG TPA: transcriptional regulator [Sedimentisphaerales bacterium]|nr:transcriptional regulator [Sedimentisphaerales bacterium]
MARGDQLVRQWELLKVLQANRFGIGIDELVAKMNCTRRTVERDLAVLRKVSFPIECEERDFGKKFWKLKTGFIQSDNMLLDLPAVVSLHLAGQLLSPLAGTQLGDGIRELQEKIKKALPQKASNHFRDLADTLYVRMPIMEDASAHQKELEIIQRAITEKRTVMVSYKPRYKGGLQEIEFHPYGVVVYGVSIYVIGYSVYAKDTRLLKLTRLDGVQLTDKKFVRPDDFSLENCFGYSFGVISGQHKKTTVRCRFTGWAATHIREIKWHKTQTIEEDTGDELLVSFLLDSTVEFIRWITGFGSMAWVVEPKSVRDGMAQRLREALARYS